MFYLRLARPWRRYGRPIQYGLIIAFLIAAILIAGASAEAADKKPLPEQSPVPNRKWTGDFGGMLKDRVIRVLVAYSKTFYFIDQGRQRGLDQSKRSDRGAVGVMQILPSTAADPNIGIAGIEKLENNIHAGTKYLRFIIDRYYAEEPMNDGNKKLFGLASYNAGPARVKGLRQKAVAMGLDPNLWFYNVEVVAAQEIGRETVQYVGNIYKYYIVYRSVFSQLEKKKQLRKKNAGSK
jgi:membrane-bound lytic murein transglycosylase MltF